MRIPRHVPTVFGVICGYFCTKTRINFTTTPRSVIQHELPLTFNHGSARSSKSPMSACCLPTEYNTEPKPPHTCLPTYFTCNGASPGYITAERTLAQSIHALLLVGCITPCSGVMHPPAGCLHGIQGRTQDGSRSRKGLTTSRWQADRLLSPLLAYHARHLPLLLFSLALLVYVHTYHTRVMERVWKQTSRCDGTAEWECNSDTADIFLRRGESVLSFLPPPYPILPILSLHGAPALASCSRCVLSLLLLLLLLLRLASNSSSIHL